MQTFINNFRTTIAATFGDSDTTLQLLSSAGLPDLGVGEWYLLTLFRLAGVEESGHEVVQVTARTGNQLTVVRGYEGAAPTQFLTGDIVAARITAASLNGKADLGWATTQLAGKEPTIAPGTTGQYWRGDKTWATLNKAAVGLSAVDNTADVDKPVSTAQAAADTTVLNSAKVYAEGLVVGLYDDRGNYNASGNVFPSAGGSGPGGAIMKGDIWRITVAGNLGGTDVAVDQQIRALVDSPAQTSSNWGISGANFTITQSVTNGATGVVPSSDAVFDALVVKANSNNAALTGTASVENLAFSGATRRISGDFSHATHSNRVLFQTSTGNSATSVGAIPSGSGNIANLNVFNTSDPNNAAGLQLGASSAVTAISSFITGSGTYLPLVFNTGGAERARFDAANYNTALLGGALEDNSASYRTLSLGSGTTGSAGTVVTFKDSAGSARGQISSNTAAGIQIASVSTLPMLFYTNSAERMRLSGSSNRLQADFSNATVASRLFFQSSVANGNTIVGTVPNGTSTASSYAVYNGTDPDNTALMSMNISNTLATLTATKNGTGTTLPLAILTNGTERLRFAASTYTAQIKTNDADLNNRFAFQDVTSGVATSLDIIPGTSHNSAQVVSWSQPADRNNSGFMSIGISNSLSYLHSGKTGSGTSLPLAVSCNSIESFRIDTGGNVNFGTSNSGDPLSVRINGTQFNQGTKAFYSRSSSSWELGMPTSSGTNISFYTDNGTVPVAAGTISSTGSTTSYNTSSDHRLKGDVEPMTGALDSVKQIQFMTWRWKGDGRLGEGVIANKLQEIPSPIPDAVQGTKDAVQEDGETPIYQGVDYSKLVPRIGCSVQELAALLEAAVHRIAVLEAKIGGAA